MRYAVMRGESYLKNRGEGWSRWSTVPEDAEIFLDRGEAARVAEYMMGCVIPHWLDDATWEAEECGAQ